jgi:curli biogenesis system outer membrane secretion channel CsgG
MKTLATVSVIVLASACTHAVRTTSEPRIEKKAPVVTCTSNVNARLAVHPLGNKSGADLKLDGMDDIMISEMTKSGCFQEIERDKDKMAVLFEEVDRCAPDNKDRARFNCDTFAKNGNQLGVTHFVFADVIMFAPNVAGSELQASVPGVGNIQTNEKYAAIVVNVRAVDAASGEVAASAVVHAILPSQKAGLDLGMKGANLKVAAESNTPIGDALMDSLRASIGDLHNSWRDTHGNGSAAAPAPAATTPPAQ